MPSGSKNWKRIRNLEDALWLVGSLDERRRVILKHALYEGSWDAVFDEASKMGTDVRELRRHLSKRWRQLYDDRD